MLMPARVEPTFTEAQHTRSVAASACGDGVHELAVGGAVAPLCTSAREAADEVDAHLLAGAVHGHGDGREVVGWLAAAQISAMGVTEMRLFTMGMPNSRSSCSAVGTSFSAAEVMRS